MIQLRYMGGPGLSLGLELSPLGQMSIALGIRYLILLHDARYISMLDLFLVTRSQIAHPARTLKQMAQWDPRKR